jgi:hypothetical protein
LVGVAERTGEQLEVVRAAEVRAEKAAGDGQRACRKIPCFSFWLS